MSTGASTTRTVAEAHARLRADGAVQFDLPMATQPRSAPPPKWLIDMIEALGPFAQFILWALVALMVGLVLWAVLRRAGAYRKDRDVQSSPQQEEAVWRPEEKAARALLAEADAMAEAGRYDEAAHLLLHRSLEDIARRRPQLLRPALTSREIARVPALPERVRATFAAMAAPVERSLFGGHRLDRTAWEEARAAYRDFALREAWA